MNKTEFCFCTGNAKGRKKIRSDCLEQVNFALGQVKVEVWRATETSLSNQNFQNLRLQDEKYSESEVWINLKFKRTKLLTLVTF